MPTARRQGIEALYNRASKFIILLASGLSYVQRQIFILLRHNNFIKRTANMSWGKARKWRIGMKKFTIAYVIILLIATTAIVNSFAFAQLPASTSSTVGTTTLTTTIPPWDPSYWGCSTSSGCQKPSNTLFWEPCAAYASYLIFNSTGIKVNPIAILDQWQQAENNYGTVSIGQIVENFGHCDPGGVLTASGSSTASQFAQAYGSYVVQNNVKPFIKNFPQCISYGVGTENYNAITSNAQWASVLEFGNYHVASDSGSYTGAFYAPNSGLWNSWYRQACGTCAADALGITCPPNPRPDNTTLTSYPVQTTYSTGQASSLQSQNTPPFQGSIITTLQATTYNTPIITGISKYNNQSAAWLITCPDQPDLTKTQLFFTTANTSFIAGDMCMSNDTTLNSNVYDRVFLYGNGGLDGPAASSFAMVSIGNAAQGIINDTAYSGEVEQQGSNTFAIGNGRNSQSYIFDTVPSEPQQGIWTWSARYANLSSFNNSTPAKKLTIGAPTLEQTFMRIDPIPTLPFVQITSWICSYQYNFSSYSNITYVKNTNITIPSQRLATDSVGDTLMVNGQIYSGFTPSSNYASPGGPLSCAAAMYYGTLQNQQACNNDGWVNYISSSGMLNYGGAKGTVQSNLYVYQDPNDNTKLWVAYMGQNGEYGEGYVSTNPASGVTTLSNSTITPILPFFLYNSSIPVSSSDATWATAYVNSSFDLYSPNNYLAANMSLDPLTIDTGSGFFGTRNGSFSMFPLSLLSPHNATNMSLLNNQTNFTLALNSSYLHTDIGSTTLPAFEKKVGNYFEGGIYNPIFAGVAPNNYVYVVNLSSHSSFLSFSKTTESYLFALKFVPNGDYNLSSGAAPNSVPPAGTYTAWNKTWSSYWANTTKVQSSNLYITSVYQLTNVKSNFWSIKLSPNGEPKINDFVPVSIASDDFGDLYLFGHPTSTFWKRDFGTVPTQLAVIDPGANRLDVATMSVPAAYASTAEFTVSPDGKTIYLATPQSPNVLIYGFTYVLNKTSNVLVANVYQNGQIDLNYSTPSYSLSIGSYLANGGPYNNSAMAKDFATSAGSINDISTNHHPLAIFDYKGNLYVLDDWNISGISTIGLAGCTTFDIGCGASGPDWFNILMLRAFYINNTEVPVNPSLKMDLVPPPSQSVTYDTQAASTFKASLPSLLPPFGWPLSANITDAAGDANGGYSYCAANCEYTPSSNLNVSYLPVGPKIDLNSPSMLGNNIGTSIDLNGTFYLLAHTSTDLSTPYTELLSVGIDFANYTNLGLGGSENFKCYINITTTSSTPCDQLYGNNQYSDALTYLRPPIAASPSGFEYAENTGYYRSFLGIAQAFYSTFPTSPTQNGTDTQLSPSSSNSQLSNAFNSSISGFAAGISNVAGQPLTTPPNVISAINFGFTYLNSSIGGYVLVPYTANYIINQTWDQDPVQNGTFVSWILSPQSGSNINENNACNFNYYLPHNGGISVVNLVPYTFTPINDGKNSPKAQPFCKITSMNYDSASGNSTAIETCTIYSAQQAYLLSKHDPNATIEGGGTYATFMNGSFWQPSISDQATIMPANLQMNLFSNRLFGEIYVNRTVYDANVFATPNVINASHIADYMPLFYTQGASEPGYVIENAIYVPDNSSLVGVQAVNGGNLQNYYYNPSNRETMATNFSTSQLDLGILAPPLFDEYMAATYYGTLGLQFLSNSILGYNRIIYTYIDRFNNTIYMPMSIDFSNTTTINMNLTTIINGTNANQSIINVSGVAGYVSPLSSNVVPLPQGSKIYIYYDHNINYYNSSDTYIGQSGTGASQSFWQFGQQCVLSANATGPCILANPLATSTQKNEPNVADSVAYHPQYNSSGKCAPQPKSLLDVGNNIATCNIYGNFGLPKISQLPSNPNAYEYCVPILQNGNGILTSQLGLVGEASVLSNGAFNLSFTACGVGQATITAQYYGWPPPEPITVLQPSLQNSVVSLAGNKDSKINTVEYAFTNSPADAIGTVNIGNYVLSMGDIWTLGIVAVIAALVAMAAWPKDKKGRKNDKRKERSKVEV